MCIVGHHSMSSIGCGTITKAIKTPVEDLGLDADESLQRQTIATCCNCPTKVTNRSITNWRRSSLLLQEGPCPVKLCRADCIKEDCSHDYCCLCTVVSCARQSAAALGP
ncbi:hypothetical protein AVEN_66249-1 [Araneus ventricosus]|uniref:Uncharacterized protein n=1 Tax=Araneus ventricosus TaxID=182803 RepID=A0A4Y2IY46_ARAVE|nr:hypothetical protein AVEN_66249-1 [Araneus ventricosus]